MTDTTYDVMKPEKGVLIKAWTKGVPLEDAARQQLLNVAQLPFIYKWVAAMPDVHWGMGATIGSVIPTRGAIIPAAVGVDIGCGMMAVQTSLHANHLPDNLHGIRTAIEKAVPHGRTDNGRANDRGAWSDAPSHHAEVWAKMEPAYKAIVGDCARVLRASLVRPLSTTDAGSSRDCLSGLQGILSHGASVRKRRDGNPSATGQTCPKIPFGSALQVLEQTRSQDQRFSCPQTGVSGRGLSNQWVAKSRDSKHICPHTEMRPSFQIGRMRLPTVTGRFK
ncbi:MAG: RtcB family protein [Acidobacteriia bacterium]|nr:RtcB family protein [Terriglobia bacterium]